jgi:hypothetical protein
LVGTARPAATASETFATHLTATDRSKSLTAAGTRQGLFRVVYRFENEQLLEVNRTAHAAALSTLVETANTYRFYFAVYVCNVSRFTPIYMALIDPFRKLIVYPSLLRSVCASWNKAFGTAELTLVWRHIAALPSQPVSQFGKRLLAGLGEITE